MFPQLLLEEGLRGRTLIFGYLSQYDLAIDKLRNMLLVFDDSLVFFLFFCSLALNILLFQALRTLQTSLVILLFYSSCSHLHLIYQ